MKILNIGTHETLIEGLHCDNCDSDGRFTMDSYARWVECDNCGQRKEVETITCCTSHVDEQLTPMLSTMAFRGAERWCPYCEKTGGMLGAGVYIPSTPELVEMEEKYRAAADDYLHANGCSYASGTQWKLVWGKPDRAPRGFSQGEWDKIDDWKAWLEEWREMNREDPEMVKLDLIEPKLVVHPRDLPQHEKDRLAAILEKGWKHEVKVEKLVVE